RSSATQASSGGRQFAVFYLKYAEATTAAETLAKVFGGGGGGGGGIVEDLAGAALGGLGGGLMGDLLGLGGGGGAAGGFSSTSVDIVPDARLNALVVYAQPSDLDTVDQLLRVLDQRTGPEPVEAGGKARLIPVVNTSAATVAEVVQQVFQDRIQSSGGGGGRQPSPEDLIRALRRGSGGGGGGNDQEPSKMSIGVDTRSNSLVVRAPDPLFDQVKELVQQLDREGVGTPQSTRIVSLQHTNALALREALSSLLGEGVVTSTPGAANGTNEKAKNSGGNSNRQQQDNGAATREMMQRIEMFRRMRDNLQRGGGGGRSGGRGPGGEGGGRGGPGGGRGSARGGR
ncbi:MAG: secretin N-terminal domain-containing protein, partial [Planctomycetota bacterium]